MVYWILCFIYGFRHFSILLVNVNSYLINKYYSDKHYPNRPVDPEEESANHRKFSVTNLAYTPSFILFFSTVVFVIVIIILAVGVDQTNIPAKGFIVYGVEYSFIAFGVAAIMITLILGCYLFTLRLYTRA